VTRSSVCSGVKECRTERAHDILYPKSSFPIRRNTVLGMSKYSAIILDAIRRSFFNKSATAAMFTSARVDLSSSTSSLPSRSWENHLKTFHRIRASFPWVFCTNTSVSVADDRLWNKILWQLSVSFRHRKLTLQDKLYKSNTVEDKQTKLAVWADVVW